METVFINSENSKQSDPHRFRLDLTDKLNLKDFNKEMALAWQLSNFWKTLNIPLINCEI